MKKRNALKDTINRLLTVAFILLGAAVVLAGIVFYLLVAVGGGSFKIDCPILSSGYCKATFSFE